MDYYNIYHPFDGVINHDCSTDTHMFEYIGMVKAVSLNDAFTKSQNDFNDDYAELNRRSTCVGDIIAGPDNTCHMITGNGFKKVPAVTLLNLGKIVDKIHFETVAQQVLDNPEDYGLI